MKYLLFIMNMNFNIISEERRLFFILTLETLNWSMKNRLKRRRWRRERERVCERNEFLP